ncbi:MAG: zinc ribbon domain-containing protein [candidate division NC10 bacterium]|nr:zinc ribbon domain-containing protein [candidate division NC10 bacterium]
MVILVTVGLLVGLAILIGYPLIKGSSDGSGKDTSEPEGLRELQLRKESVYAALKDLEFDYRTGKLSEQDYKELDEQYRYQAMSLLREIERTEEGEDLSDRIEEEVRALRKARTKAPGLRCPSCQGQYRPGDRFCPSCGGHLASACPGCGAPYEEGDNYCSKCGKPLKIV